LSANFIFGTLKVENTLFRDNPLLMTNDSVKEHKYQALFIAEASQYTFEDDTKLRMAIIYFNVVVRFLYCLA